MKFPWFFSGRDLYVGSHWMQGAVYFLIAALLGLGLLSALDNTKEQAESLSVSLLMRNIRTGMQWAMAEKMMQGKQSDIAGWVGGNPLMFLGSSPRGYLGECNSADACDMSGGSWCFDVQRRELAYQPQGRRHLRLERPTDACNRPPLRWRLGQAAKSVANDGMVGLRVEIVTPYTWLME